MPELPDKQGQANKQPASTSFVITDYDLPVQCNNLKPADNNKQPI